MQGIRVGYVRVSTQEQSLSRQLAGVQIDKCFEDKQSGKDRERPGLTQMIEFVREGDTVVVHSLDRLARNLVDLKEIVNDITKKGVTVEFVKERLIFSKDDDNPFSVLLMSVLGSFAEFERALIKQRQLEGIIIAKNNGAFKGRKKALSPTSIDELRKRVRNGEVKAKVARDYDISRVTLYEYLKTNED